MKTFSKTRKLKPPEKVILSEIEAKLDGPWKPVSVVELNNIFSVKMVSYEGEFPKWHYHANEDEFFLVIKGEVVIQTELGNVPLNEGEGAVVRRGVKHCSKSDKGAIVLVIERTETKPAGDG
ncbi:MAG: cupin domain-containing protein [candidate division Zixibacteria bacterium]|nr:cupin domain-containing protein [candidate division Zixibacteria bacterium]